MTGLLLLSAGNLLVNPEAALLFIDFTTGDTLHLSGHAEVQWQKTDLPGAQRTVAFQTEEWVHVKGALPFSHKGPVESSPYNPTPPQTSGRPEVCLGRDAAAYHANAAVIDLHSEGPLMTCFC